ncbi:MAG: histidine phosphatase family protein [Actinomycetota bacterium]
MSRVLYLIRHGRSDFDSAEMSATARGEQWDPPLSEEGRRQAQLLAARLRVMELDPVAVYCSPLRRTRETVAPYADGAGLDVVFDEDLIEAHIGGWEGLPFEEIVASDADLVHRIRNQQAIWSRAPGGESERDFRARIVTALDSILGNHPEGDVVVVAHGGVINAYCGEVLGLPSAMFFLPENTSINSVVVDGDRRTVRFLNDIAHLTDPRLFEEG